MGYVGIFKAVSFLAYQTVNSFLIVNDECEIVKEAKDDTNLLSQEPKLVNLQLNLCPSKSTTPVLKRIFFQCLKVNLQT